MVTNSAFGLVQRSEEEIISIAPALFNRKRSWATIAIIIFFANAFEQGVNSEARLGTEESLRITPFDDFIYLSTARILMKFLYLSESPGEITCMDHDTICFPLRVFYKSRPELLDDPEMKKKEEEDLKLSQFVIDKNIWNTFREETSKGGLGIRPPLEDELCNGVGKLLKEGVISVATVLAAQIYLDVQDIMAKNDGEALKDLQVSTKDIDKIMKLRIIDHSWDVDVSGGGWHPKDSDMLKRIKSTSLQWVLENLYSKFKEIVLTSKPPAKLRTMTFPFGQAPPDLLGPSQSSNQESSLVEAPVRPRPPKDPRFATGVSQRLMNLTICMPLSHLIPCSGKKGHSIC